ncbi:MAG TPA: hypothetical protein VNR90_13335, partial [Vicinamibacterales bacterium]|nr:hypothetical protein [Vicinamibacterales bacterium]
MSARVLACALVMLAAGAARAQDASPPAPDAGVSPAVESGADAGAPGPDAGAADGAGAPGPDALPEQTPVAPPVAAPQVTALLRATVFARGGHRRIKGATVFIDGVAVGDTDARGELAVKAVPGRHHVQAIASRYQAADITVDLPPQGWAGELRLLAGGQTYETVVAAKPVTPMVRVDGDTARTTAGTGGDPFRVIESMPGVSQIVWPFALYAIRGANPGNTGFFLDGMRVPALFHFALGPSIVHPYLIDKMSFYPGGYPARLGGYVSGVVTADTATPPGDIARFTADVRLYDAGALVTTPWDGGRGTVAVAARYAYTGLIVSR